jgi:predicted DCC family thiol-disulfide oxidoreductase YuxK
VTARCLPFRIAPDDLARETLVRHARNPSELSTLLLVLDPGRPTERLLDKSTAALLVLRQLTGVWKVVGSVTTLVPAALRDVVYDFVAHVRYRTFGKYEICPIPAPEVRDRFLDP